jgi:hypothetical protein
MPNASPSTVGDIGRRKQEDLLIPKYLQRKNDLARHLAAISSGLSRRQAAIRFG